MKKILLLILLLACLMLAACGNAKTTTPPDTQAPDTQAPPPENTLPAEGVFTALREGDAVTLNVTLPTAKNSEVSVLLVKDPDYLHTWAEDPDARLVNLGQISLDGEGKGSITLSCKDAASFYAVVTAESGCYIAEVK